MEIQEEAEAEREAVTDGSGFVNERQLERPLAKMLTGTPKIERCLDELRSGIRIEENFHWLYKKHCRSLWYFFANRGLTDAECEDLTQEVFIRVYKNINKFRGEASFNTWILRIARNLWLKQIRREKTQKRTAEELPLAEVLEAGTESRAAVQNSPFVSAGDPQANTLMRERQVLLRRAVEALPPQMRRSLTLRLISDLKYKEIAELMQISIDAVKSHLGQGRARLRKELTEL